jgi:hypothetical protein
MGRTLIVISALLIALSSPLLQAQTDATFSEQVQKMYISYYGRPGDQAGIDYWADQLESTGDLANIIDAFGNSDEYDDRFGSLSNTELVNNIFNQLLDRDADAEGLAFYRDGLDAEEFTLASIALNIANGIPEGTSDALTYANKLAVAVAFTEAIAESDADYGVDEIEAAVALLSAVNSTDNLDEALATVDDLIDELQGTVVDDEPIVDDGPIDITNAIFAETSGDCALSAHVW